MDIIKELSSSNIIKLHERLRLLGITKLHVDLVVEDSGPVTLTDEIAKTVLDSLSEEAMTQWEHISTDKDDVED